MSKYHKGDNTIPADSTPEELARFYDRNYFENNPRGYKHLGAAARESRWHDKVIEEFAKYIPVEGKRVLDAGCATGAFLRPMVEQGAEGYGIDLSAYASQVARDVIGPKFVKTGSMHELPWKDDFFDVYFTAETIEHVPYKYHRAMLHEMKRVLAPGGLVYMQGIIGFTDYLNPDPNDDAGHIAVFPRGYWWDMLKDAGLAHNGNTKELRELHKALANARYWRHYKWNFIIAQNLR